MMSGLMLWLCGIWIVLYAIGLLLWVIGLLGLFGVEPALQGGALLVVLGLPWFLIFDAFSSDWILLVAITPALNIAIFYSLYRFSEGR